MQGKPVALSRAATREKDLLDHKAFKVDVVCDASGGVKESVHKGLETELFGVANLEGRQLVFSRILAVDADKR